MGETKIKFWKAAGKANSVYLLGSMHLTDGSIYPLDSKIENAFINSQNLAVEANINQLSEEDNNYILEKSRISGDLTIKDYISEKTFEIYEKTYKDLKIDEHGVTEYNYMHLMPFSAWQYLTFLSASMEFSDSSETEDSESTNTNEKIKEITQLGIDMYFLKKAVEINKNIVEIEGVVSQIDSMLSFSKELHEELLLNALNYVRGVSGCDSENGGETPIFVKLLDSMKNGDDNLISDAVNFFDENTDSVWSEFKDKMFIQRNKFMAEKIAEYLENTENGDYFVVVGAGHFIGETGIIKLLAKMGYNVEQVN